MTTLTLKVDEKVLETAQTIALLRKSSVDQVFSDAVAGLHCETDPANHFLAALKEFQDEKYSLPILTRDELNARR